MVSDKCGDAYAAPLPDPSAALKHLLGHTAMTITAMVSLKGGALLATADRAEHIRVSLVRQALLPFPKRICYLRFPCVTGGVTR